jgi:hypothetical protein
MSRFDETVKIAHDLGGKYILHPITFLTANNFEDFYAWFTSKTKKHVPRNAAINFIFVDLRNEREATFILPHGDLESFQLLKQYIWNLFWAVDYDLEEGAQCFRIKMEPECKLKILNPQSFQHPQRNSINSSSAHIPPSNTGVIPATYIHTFQSVNPTSVSYSADSSSSRIQDVADDNGHEAGQSGAISKEQSHEIDAHTHSFPKEMFIDSHHLQRPYRNTDIVSVDSTPLDQDSGGSETESVPPQPSMDPELDSFIQRQAQLQTLLG